VILTAYALAFVAAFAVGWPIRQLHPFAVAGAADLAATIVVFLFSRIHRNSSVYDPYWSVAPLPLGIYFAARAGVVTPRTAIALVLLAVWGVRLTYNWWRRWDGLEHEDWRYVDLERKSGRFYWPVSFLGIHLFPTVLVFAGCLPLWAIATSRAPLGIADLFAVLFTTGAIAIEAIADRQLHRHATSEHRSDILASGLWKLSRHPNYLGEISLWWGILFLALSAGSRVLWIAAGAIAMTMLFLFISIPMVEKRCLERRPDYRAYAEKTSKLILWPPKR
jgi:steroid 5-alpha reductase family enzyme